MQRAIYVGAGLDIMPALLFPQIKEFMFVDSLPFSAHGNIAYNVHADRVTYVARDQRAENAYSRRDFLPRLRRIIMQNNFELAEDAPDYLLFRGEDSRVLQYFHSCAFPEHITPAIANKLSGADTLIIAGHDPHHDVLGFMSPPFTLIVNNNTVYTSDPTDQDYRTSTCRELRDNQALIGACHKYTGKPDYVPYDCQNAAAAATFRITQVNAADIFAGK